MADALCLLPEPLGKGTLNLKFVDMANLQPEAWLFENTTDKSTASIFKKCKEPITDILDTTYCKGSCTYRYTLHLLALEECSPKGDVADPCLAPINTPCTLKPGKACLRLHPDQKLVQYFMRGITWV